MNTCPVSLRLLFNEHWVKGLIWWQDLSCCIFFMSCLSVSAPFPLTEADTSGRHHEEAIVRDHDSQDAVAVDTFALGLSGGCTSRWEHVEGNNSFCSQGTKGIRGRDLGPTILFKAPVTQSTLFNPHLLMVHISPNGDTLGSLPPPNRSLVDCSRSSYYRSPVDGSAILVLWSRHHQGGVYFGEQAVLRLRAVGGFPGLGSRTWQGGCSGSLSLM